MLRRLAAPIGRLAGGGGAGAGWRWCTEATSAFSSGAVSSQSSSVRHLVSPEVSECLNPSSTADMQFAYESDQLVDEAKVVQKESTLNTALSKLSSDFDQPSNLRLDRFFCLRRTSVISTGSLKLDLALGIGGLPKGRIVEIYGKEASGKTTLALHIIKEAQKMGGYCAFIDVENALNPLYVNAIGVDNDKLLIAQPGCAEHSLSILNTLVNSGSVDVIVVDSVAALAPQAEIDGVIDLDSQEVQSQFMTRALHKIQASLCRSQTIVIFVNQVRANVKQAKFISDQNEVTCGGNALRFHSAIRLRISRRQLLQTSDKIAGVNIIVQIIKNKLAPAAAKASLDLVFGRGLNREAEILEMAASHGIITSREGGYLINGKFLKDHKKAEEYLVENRSITEELFDNMRAVLFGGAN